jgi:glycosyltransferase involved in cell wall biosynthesis
MTVVYNTNFTHNPNSYLTLAIHDAAVHLFGATNVVLADNRSLAPIAASGVHDTLICIDGQRLQESLLRRVRPAFRTVIMWLFEDPFMLDYNIKNRSLFDYIFTNDPECVPSYGGKGHYLPLGASPKFHHRPVRADADLEYDIFFAGTMWPNRIQSLRRITAAFPDARLKLVCPTNEYLPPLPSDLAQLAIQWPISHESFIDFANASRVTLTMFRDYASHGTVGQATAPGPRLYELGLSGTAQVVECGDTMDARHFETLRGIDVVRDPGALVAGISRLLEDPALREREALAAQESIAERHLYTQRLERIREVTGANFGIREMPTARGPSSRKLRVLMCTHSTIHRKDWGGVEVYQQTLSAMFEHEVEIFFWLRRDNQCCLMDNNGIILERFDFPDVGWLDSLTDAAEEVPFANVLGQYDFDLVHFQHLGHHTASLPIIAKAAGVGTVFSAHDFFLVCSRYNLLNHEQVFCDIGNKSISACDICLRISEGVPAGAQQTRRAFVVEMIKSIDVFLFGTAYSEALTVKIYPEMQRHRRAVLGIPMPSNAAPDMPPERERGEDAPLVVAILGNFLRSKGADAIMSIMEEANPQLFTFHLLGNAEAQYAEVFAKWNKPNVVYHGRYAPGDLALLAGADVALHLSIWPETYCISLSEVWQAGLIPIVSDIGALGDRVEHGVNGFKVRVGATSAVLDHLEMLRADPGLRRRIRSNIGPHLWTDYRSYAASLLDIYRAVAPRRALGDVGVGLDVGQVHLLPHASWKNLAPPRHIFDPSRRSSIRLELPPQIQDWSFVQGSEFCVDAVCGQSTDQIGKKPFTPWEELRISGWTFVPTVRVAGQIVIALVGQDDAPTIFCATARDIRDDIMTKFPGAPRRSGFSGAVTLRGRWSEGVYQIALINTFGDRAAFSLTPVMVEIGEAKVVGVRNVPLQNEAIIDAFYKVTAQTGEDPSFAVPSLPPSAFTWSAPQNLQLHIDAVVNTGLGVLNGADLDAREAASGDGGEWVQAKATRVALSGWAFLPGAAAAGRIYIGFLNEATQVRMFAPARRVIRDDVAQFFTGAPLCAGFSLLADVDTRWDDGTYRCAVINVVDGTACCHAIHATVRVEAGGIVAIEETNLDAAEVARVNAMVTVPRLTRRLPAPPAAPPAPPQAPAPASAKSKQASERAAAKAEPAPKPPAREGRRKAAVAAASR